MGFWEGHAPFLQVSTEGEVMRAKVTGSWVIKAPHLSGSGHCCLTWLPHSPKNMFLLLCLLKFNSACLAYNHLNSSFSERQEQKLLLEPKLEETQDLPTISRQQKVTGFLSQHHGRRLWRTFLYKAWCCFETPRSQKEWSYPSPLWWHNSISIYTFLLLPRILTSKVISTFLKRS